MCLVAAKPIAHLISERAERKPRQTVLTILTLLGRRGSLLPAQTAGGDCVTSCHAENWGVRTRLANPVEYGVVWVQGQFKPPKEWKSGLFFDMRGEKSSQVIHESPPVPTQRRARTPRKCGGIQFSMFLTGGFTPQLQRPTRGTRSRPGYQGTLERKRSVIDRNLHVTISLKMLGVREKLPALRAEALAIQTLQSRAAGPSQVEYGLNEKCEHGRRWGCSA